MIPITKRSDITCPNCVWANQKDSNRFVCERTGDTHNSHYYCSLGQFPCEVNQELVVLSFDDAMIQLADE